jgi:hypothetical protein
MKSKKSKSADISRDRGNFLLIGGVIATSFVLMAFEWSTFSGTIDMETKVEDASCEMTFSIDKPLELKKPTPPAPPKVRIQLPTDEVEEKKTIEVKQKVAVTEMDTTETIDFVVIDNDDYGEIKIENIPPIEKTYESYDPNIQIPFYDVCKNKSYDEKLNCISGKIHETLMGGLSGISSDQIARNKADKMYVSFVISKEGTITDVIIPSESDFQKGIVQRVKASMEDVPVMHPATKDGRAVAINFSIPIRFSTN